MDIFIDPDSSTGLADQIYEEVRSSILYGRLGPGDRVPPSRELADLLGVSRHTVTRAFNRLTGEGFLIGRRGGGTVVSELFTADTNPGPSNTVLQPVKPRSEPPTYDLRPSLPDRSLFPLQEWKRYARHAIDLHSGWYEDPAGLPELRLALARLIGRSRGIDATFRQIVITSGAQHAFYLIAKACLEAGARVAMEDPGYLWFRRAMEAADVEVVSVRVDDEGMVVDDIPRDVAAVYVTPSHQFPTGVVMSMRRRLDLLSLARESDMLVLEDDYDSEFRYVDRPLEPIHRLDNGDSVVYIGTMSKVLSPSLRLGYIVVPPEYLTRVVDFRQRMDLGPRGFDQQILRHFITDGHLLRHIRKAHRIYQRRRDKVIRQLSHLARIGVVEDPKANAGLHASAPLAPGLDEAQILSNLYDSGFAIDGFSDYQHDPDGPSGLLVGFGSLRDDRVDEALDILGEVVVEASN